MRAVYVLCLLSLLYWGGIRFFPARGARGPLREMRAAAETMAAAEAALLHCRGGADAVLSAADINRTGLLGREFSELTTSVGQLEAKRTTTNPNFAALAVRLLHEAGVRKGDAVAVGASSSFPGLIVAVLSACRAMGAHPLVISSLGASQWGANDPDFHWLDMWTCLRDRGLFPEPPIAVSLGGERDTGEDMPEEGRVRLRAAIGASGLPFIEQPDLVRNVERRMRLLEDAARGSQIKAFVNIGGAYANMGTDGEILHVKPGLARIRRLPPVERRGMLFAMAARGVPVIHLLFVRGLAGRFGLPWDPSPLPRPGQGELFRTGGNWSPFTLGITIVFLAAAVLCVVFLRERSSGDPA